MFLMRADPLRGQVRGGWALEIKTFLGPEMAGPGKVSIYFATLTSHFDLL